MLGVLGIAALVAVVKFVLPMEKEKDMTPTDTGKNPEPKPMTEKTTTAPVVPAAKDVAIKTSYASPAGTDEVGFTLSVDAMGTIIGAKTDVLTAHPISKKRQEAFADGLLPVVKGKNSLNFPRLIKLEGLHLPPRHSMILWMNSRRSSKREACLRQRKELALGQLFLFG